MVTNKHSNLNNLTQQSFFFLLAIVCDLPYGHQEIGRKYVQGPGLGMPHINLPMSQWLESKTQSSVKRAWEM